MFVCSTVNACSIGGNLHRVGFIVSGFKVSGFKGKCDKVINLTTNRGEADFLITGGADENKFSLSGTTLTFKATDFEARDDKPYSVEIAANRAGINGGANEHAAKTITVTVTDAFSGVEISVVVMARLGSTVMVNLLEVLLPAGSVT
jgi:hypothetical protein